MKRNLLLLLVVLFIFSCSSDELIIPKDPDKKSSVASTRGEYDKGVSLERRYDIARYRWGIENKGYSSSVIYYPKNSQLKKMPVVVLLHGFLRSKEMMAWTGRELAKRGFIAMVVTGRNFMNPFTNPRAWVYNFDASIRSIKAENDKKRSPLYNRIDVSKISIVGHSMGGGGSIFFGDSKKHDIKCIVALAPYCAEYQKPGSKINVPTMVIAGGRDVLAPSGMTQAIYNAIGTSQKEYVYFKNARHLDFEIRLRRYPKIAENIYRWLVKYGV